jgi:hypothetical protein
VIQEAVEQELLELLPASLAGESALVKLDDFGKVFATERCYAAGRARGR